MTYLRPRRLLEIRGMWSAQLLAILAFTPNPDLGTQARHGMADVPLVGGGLRGRADLVELLVLRYRAAQTVEEVRVASS